MPDRPEYGVEDDGQSTLISTPSNNDNLSIRLGTGADYEVKVIEIGPRNSPLACTICVNVPNDYLVDAGPADIVCPQCAQAIRRALDVHDGTRALQARQATLKLTLDDAARLTGLPIEDIKELVEV